MKEPSFFPFLPSFLPFSVSFTEGGYNKINDTTSYKLLTAPNFHQSQHSTGILKTKKIGAYSRKSEFNMIKEELLLSKAGKECSVTELLELERKMYQENIDRNQKIHEELRRGTLKEFRNKCQPFEDEQNKNLLRAKVRLQLNQKNINDLLEFELQQAKDVYEVS
jgi:hypothetical protein